MVAFEERMPHRLLVHVFGQLPASVMGESEEHYFVTGGPVELEANATYGWFEDFVGANDWESIYNRTICDGSPAPPPLTRHLELESRPHLTPAQATEALGLFSLASSTPQHDARIGAMATGWPMRCASREWMLGVPDTSVVKAVSMRRILIGEFPGLPASEQEPNWWMISEPSNFFFSERSRLWILPLGVVFDSAFFAPFWLGLMVMTSRIVRGLRGRRWKKRGRCGGCGYPLATFTRCPECGRERRQGGNEVVPLKSLP